MKTLLELHENLTRFVYINKYIYIYRVIHFLNSVHMCYLGIAGSSGGLSSTGFVKRGLAKFLNNKPKPWIVRVPGLWGLSLCRYWTRAYPVSC